MGYSVRASRPTMRLVVIWLATAALLGACSSDPSIKLDDHQVVGRVLLVGTFRGHRGGYSTIDRAVQAAKRGDWILVAPGDYHETADETDPPDETDRGQFGGVLITTSGLHLRGMDRHGVIVDGTKPGSSSCSSAPAAQDDGRVGSDGHAIGRNGIVVYRAANVSVDNLTVCNFLAGAAPSGNEVWWNGGAETGLIGMSGYRGSYLTATSTYYGGEDTAAQYGIFASNAAGLGEWDQLYASNFNDSGMYVGACLQQCDMTINHAWMEYDALGYSGTNSGGQIVIENSQFDNNKDGLDTNTQINGDPPAPQDGACRDGGKSAVTRTTSCWVFVHNDVHDNNNPNVPQAGSASNGPTGTGMTISGGNNDTVMDNTFSNNGAWGILFVPYPDSGSPSLGQSCSATGGQEMSGLGCVYDPTGDALLRNHFSHNGFFGNPSNSDFGQITLLTGKPRNCFAGNVAPDGSAPADLEATQPTCGPITTSADSGGPLLAQVLCDTAFGSCPPGAMYPPLAGVVMHGLPQDLPSMPNPCAGVPSNPWCKDGKPI
jgi:hypothetical protein